MDNVEGADEVGVGGGVYVVGGVVYVVSCVVKEVVETE